MATTFVAKDITLDAAFNDLCGFTEPEVAAVLNHLEREARGAVGSTSTRSDWSADKALETMRTFYNGYRFSEDAEISLYNPTLSPSAR